MPSTLGFTTFQKHPNHPFLSKKLSSELHSIDINFNEDYSQWIVDNFEN